MTVRIANNQIHIGWGQMKVFIVGLVTLISTIIGAAWKIRGSYDDFLKDKQETNTRLARIEKQVTLKNNTDSVQTAGIDGLAKGQKQLATKFDSVGAIIGTRRVTVIRPMGPRFYTEKWINGRLQLTEVKQD